MPMLKPHLHYLLTLGLWADSLVFSLFVVVWRGVLERSFKFYYEALDDLEFQSILLPSKYTCLCVCAVLWI